MKLRSSLIACGILAGTAIVLTTTPALAAPTRYEAEVAPATCSGMIESNWSGYSGSGFCNGDNAVGAAAQLTVSASAAGTATLGVRFANGGTTARPADVLVNGSRVAGTSFEGTGAWSTWATKTLTVSVGAGSNTIRLSPTTSDGLANIDYVDVEVGGSGGGSTGMGQPSDPNIQYYGRWNRSNSSYYSMGFAGGYLDAGFTGSSVGVRQRSTVDLYYSIDRAPMQWRRNVSGNVTLATGLSGTSHTVRIGYREREGGYNGDGVFGGLVLASGAQTVPIARPQNLVEFIGDSITVGYTNSNRPFVAYPWLTGEALQGAHTQVARSGACLVGQRGCLAMMDLFRRSSVGAPSDDWDFSTYQATAVVINLGTNDGGHGVSSTQFNQNYIVMLQRIRQAYPHAEIFAMRTFLGVYASETRNAVAARNAAGDSKVHFVDTTGWLSSSDMNDGAHPNVAGHAKIAQRLTPIIDQYLLNGQMA